MMRSQHILALTTFLALSGLAAPADAQQNRPAASQSSGSQQGTAVAQFGDWAVFVTNTSAGKICYAGSQPKKRSLDALKDVPAYFLISTRPRENVRNEVSIAMGYKLKANSDATVKVGSASFTMYTREQGAWIKNAAEEGRMVQALRGGSVFTVTGTSFRNNAATDNYSATGLGQALDRVAQECR